MKTDKKRISNALETVKDVLKKAKLSPKPLADGDGFEAHFSDDGPKVKATAQVLPEEKFVFYIVFDGTVPKRQVAAVGDFVNRANFGLTIGNFEIDIESGLVRYKSSLDFSGAELPPIFVRNIILSSIYCIETYAGSLELVMSGKKSAKEAIEAAEAALG